MVGPRRSKEKVVFNFPLTENCDSDSCSICLKQEMFTPESYQNWICHNFGFKTGCNVVEVLHDWPSMKRLLGQTGINRFANLGKATSAKKRENFFAK